MSGNKNIPKYLSFYPSKASINPFLMLWLPLFSPPPFSLKGEGFPLPFRMFQIGFSFEIFDNTLYGSSTFSTVANFALQSSPFWISGLIASKIMVKAAKRKITEMGRWKKMA